MRREIGLHARLPEWGNLERALYLALKAKRNRPEVAAFQAGLPGTLEDVGRRLREGLGPHGRYRDFTLHDPKKRLISAPCFSDRVLHHAVMGVCDLAFERWLIRQTFACRVGRGLRAAITEAAHWTSRQTWYLKLDVRHYFETIPRRLLFRKVERLFGEVEMLLLWWQLIDSHRPGEPNGLPIGALTSQHLANFYLGFLDRFIKETLRVRGYVRYMDDMLLWSDDKTALLRQRDEVMRFVDAELSLTLKPPVLNRTRDGLDFLGFRFHPGWVGLSRSSRRRLRTRLRSCRDGLASGRLTECEAQQRSTACLAAVAPARCLSFRRLLMQDPSSSHFEKFK